MAVSDSVHGQDNRGFSDKEDGDIMKKPRKKKESNIEIQFSRDAQRTRCLTSIRETALGLTLGTRFEKRHVEQILQRRDFNGTLFSLFDMENTGSLPQTVFLDQLKTSLSLGELNWRDRNEVSEFVDIIEMVTFLVCKEDDITVSQFSQIFGCKGCSDKLLACMDTDKDGKVTLEEFMAFITLITSRKNSDSLKKENLDYLEKVFMDNLRPGQIEFTVDEFKNILPSKNKYFLERAFTIFDKDNSGTISLVEFTETMQQFANQDDDYKIQFLFKVYDPNGDGVIDQSELSEVLKACMSENGMNFDTEEVDRLSLALYQDAVKEGEAGITADDLKDEFERHPGLLENLTVSIEKWLVPPKPAPEKTFRQKLKEKIPHQFSKKYILNNRSYILFAAFLVIVNLVLFIARAVYFKDFPLLHGDYPNFFYILSRACGRTLLFNSTVLLILVLRYSLTTLRNMGLAAYLPLDHNIGFHIRVGQVIFIQAWIHTLMHLINFGVNIQPDPVYFLQKSAAYFNSSQGNWTTLGYQFPEGCELVETTSPQSRFCPTVVQNTYDFCQSCSPGHHPWSYADWLLTDKPGLFGLSGGIANPTGVALILILSIIFFGSLKVVRRSGYFQVFYFTHLLNFLYWLMLVLHAPDFWKWIVVPGNIFILEILYRVITSILRTGKSRIIASKCFPSKVTQLVISKPPNFNYNPGDWVFIKIPDIAAFEWHPFTISSAPEVHDTFTVHIRGVGEWTNKVYKFFQENQVTEGVTKSKYQVFQKLFRQKDKRTTSSDIQTIADHLGSPIIQRRDTHPENIRVVKKSEKRRLRLDSAYEADELNRPVSIYVDGPFGSPSSNIYRAEHAVLIGTGIGITPFASILQSIIKRYKQIKRLCPNCEYIWSEELSYIMVNLKKVDFFWINRDQTSFEWFVKLLTELEREQAETGGQMGRFLDMHMYVTSALQRSDMKTVILQLAMDLHHDKEKRDLVTGLKSRMNAGRPNWNKVFSKLKLENRGKITVFFCGNPALGHVLRRKCDEFGFTFRKEVF